MESKSTLFITGAGAHIPYGFPSGKKLITDLIYGVMSTNYAKQTLGLDKTLMEILTEDSMEFISRGHLNRFINQLRESGQSSIDKFLSLESVSEDIGKSLLMIILSIYENQNNPHGKGLSVDAFEKLRNESIYNVIVDSLDLVNNGEINNSIKFITFNYDRCLEYFLYTTFRNSYKIDFQKSHQYIDNQIIHVHGSIGKFCPNESSDTFSRIKYGSDRVKNIEDSYLLELTGHIENFQTAFTSNYLEKKEKISEFIKNSDEIVFLGFAFADENLEALSLVEKEMYEDKDIYFSTYGLTNRKVKSIESKFQNVFKNSRISFDETRNKDGATFLRDHWVM